MVQQKRGFLYFLPFIFLAIGLLLLLMVALITDDSTIRILSLSLFFLILAASILYYYLHLTAPLRKFHQKLYHLSWNSHTYSLEDLKTQYQELYILYLKLPEHKKANVYTTFTKLRETIEDSLKVFKKFEHFLETIEQGSFSEQKLKFQHLQELFQQLSPPDQQKYQSYLNQIQERLARGITP